MLAPLPGPGRACESFVSKLVLSSGGFVRRASSSIPTAPRATARLGRPYSTPPSTSHYKVLHVKPFLPQLPGFFALPSAIYVAIFPVGMLRRHTTNSTPFRTTGILLASVPCGLLRGTAQLHWVKTNGKVGIFIYTDH